MNNRTSRGAILLYMIIAIMVIFFSYMFVKARQNPDPTAPRAPMHDSK